MRVMTAANFQRHWATVSGAEQHYWLDKLSRTGDYVSFANRHGFRIPGRMLKRMPYQEAVCSR